MIEQLTDLERIIYDADKFYINIGKNANHRYYGKCKITGIVLAESRRGHKTVYYIIDNGVGDNLKASYDLTAIL